MWFGREDLVFVLCVKGISEPAHVCELEARWFCLFTHRFVLTFFFLKFLSIIWGHFQPSRLKMSHFSAEIVPRPDKISAENVRKISDIFYGRDNFGTISALKLSSSGTISALKWSRQGHIQPQARDIFSPRQGTFSGKALVKFSCPRCVSNVDWLQQRLLSFEGPGDKSRYPRKGNCQPYLKRVFFLSLVLILSKVVLSLEGSVNFSFLNCQCVRGFSSNVILAGKTLFLFFVLKVYQSQLMSVNSRRGGFTYSRTDLFWRFSFLNCFFWEWGRFEIQEMGWDSNFNNVGVL